MLNGLRVTLLVGGSIAAYKSVELVRLLTKKGARVNVAMSRAATEFVTPLTFQTLTGHSVRTDFFDADEESKIGHIALADNADLVVVAPATADMIAKAAAGMADDLPTAILLATRAPKLFAPAMNVNMWTNPATVRNISVLREFGVNFVEPGEGELACGWQGMGRLAEPAQIIEEIAAVLAPKDLLGSHVVVTAGATREWCDPIRFISNRSSGKMGFALARRARMRGARVSLVSGPSHLEPPAGVDVYRVSTAVEMRERVMELVCSNASGTTPSTQFVFMAAAVCDHRPAEISNIKLKNDKSQAFSLEMVPNPDILNELGARRAEIEESSGSTLKLIGFTAETGDEEELLQYAQEKLERKNADLIVGNFAEDSFEKDTNRVWLLARSGRQVEVATADKHLVAERIISAALRL